MTSAAVVSEVPHKIVMRLSLKSAGLGNDAAVETPIGEFFIVHV